MTDGRTHLAQRIARLGTETAFAVSAEAAAWQEKGNRVYPFHLGDMDLPTPQNIVDAAMKAIADGKTGYCPNAGIMPLREALAADVSASHGVNYGPENVAVQPGGKPVIGKFLLTLMDPGDEVLYPNPGFPIYESQIEFLGGVAKPYGFVPGETDFLLDFDAIEAAITPRTKLLIFNNQHNPTGAESPDTEIETLAELARNHDLYVLSDEAYWDIRYSGRSRSIASLPDMQERTVILYTFSKKYAMTGWRLGAAIGPQEIITHVATLNVNQESCTTHFIQYAGVEALTGDQSGAKKILGILKDRRDVAVRLLNDIPGVSCYAPEATFYLFPDMTELMERKGYDTYDELRRAVLEQTGVSFCTRLHFGRELPGETRRYGRFAYSGIPVADIEEGLGKLKAWAEQ
ncbi:MAG TPA: aminotransferase class I/II-fold pyridoxal phosphate-dependent enzyme [Thermoleophilia bacterium]|nr:aminotransferase class I/II-fold pyridoxal phosphate-dependent enzyme [Thermoleophilia bacterium]HQG02737.1 aminotransferase class I/II-fold pyridoxal phosphate-dependent enzyme [Thermoleophilia bacterium]HQG54012.1 aminotransferase class I/II-fold pyridoxal phosphate-dependent enzyme [Thermoleophilia bacterium]